MSDTTTPPDFDPVAATLERMGLQKRPRKPEITKDMILVTGRVVRCKRLKADEYMDADDCAHQERGVVNDQNPDPGNARLQRLRDRELAVRAVTHITEPIDWAEAMKPLAEAHREKVKAALAANEKAPTFNPTGDELIALVPEEKFQRVRHADLIDPDSEFYFDTLFEEVADRLALQRFVDSMLVPDSMSALVAGKVRTTPTKR